MTKKVDKEERRKLSKLAEALRCHKNRAVREEKRK
jgi:hypothetical protein